MSSVEDEDSWIVLSSMEQSGASFQNEPCIKLEIYEYPDDCLPAELVAHFLEVFDALCITPEKEIDRMFNETKTYVLAFRLSDAKRILKVPTQLLEEEETGSKIQIRVLQTKSHSVLFGCGTERVNARMVRKSLRGIEIHSCKPMGECAIIVTFKNLEDAERVVTRGTAHSITQRLSAHVCYWDELSGNEITMMTNTKLPAVQKQADFNTDSSILQALSTSANNQKHRQDTGALCQSFRMSPRVPLSIGVQKGPPAHNYNIYGNNTAESEGYRRDLERKLEKAVTTMIWSEKSTYIDDKELITKLQEDRISWLVQRGNEMRVRVTIDKRLQNIRIVGLPTDVAAMSDLVTRELKNIDNIDIEACKRDLESKLEKAVTTMIWSDKPTYSDDKELIMKLQEDRIDWLVQQGNEMQVKVKIEKRLHNIMITGLPKDVAAMSDLVTRELKNIDKRIHEESVEEMLSRTISWEYNQSGSTWTKFDQGINKQLWTGILYRYSEEQVTPGSTEYNQVEQNFLKTIGTAALQQGVLEVRRVQNLTLYQQYAILREDVAKKLNKKESDVETVPLWHGADSATVSKITAGKFDRGLAGRNATMYGVGSYFARDSAFAFNYAQPGPNGDRYMIQTRVLTGEWMQGNSAMKSAPYKNNSPTLQYDSVVDNTASPGIYVIFNDASAYPEYIIKFR